MAITVRTPASTNHTGTSTAVNLLLTFPTGTQTGDLMLEVANVQANSTTTVTAPNPSGMTKVDTQQGSTNVNRLDAWRDDSLSSAELAGGAPRVTISVASRALGATIAFGGSRYDSITDGTQTSATSATGPSVTPPVDGCLLVFMVSTACSTSNTAYTITGPSGWDTQVAIQNTHTAGRGGLYVYTKQLGAGTAGVAQTAPSASSSLSSRWLTSVMVLRPEPGHGTATGTDTWAGSAAGKRRPRGTATGTRAATGSAAGHATRRGSATGSRAWAGTAAGHTTRHGTATGSASRAGAAAGHSVRRGTAAGSITYATTAVGHAPATPNRGHGIGGINWAGQAHGVTTKHGTATGSHTWTATATGERPVLPFKHGHANGTTTRATTATGHTPLVPIPHATAHGTLTWAGTGHGTARGSRDLELTYAEGPPRLAHSVTDPWAATTPTGGRWADAISGDTWIASTTNPWAATVRSEA